MSGAIAGAIGSCAGSPFDMMKIRMMSYEGVEKRGLGSFMGEIYRSKGLVGFYTGFSTNIMRNCVFNAAKMLSYDTTKTKAR